MEPPDTHSAKVWFAQEEDMLASALSGVLAQGPQGSKSSRSLAKMTLHLHITLLLYAILLYTLLYLLMSVCVGVCVHIVVHVSAWTVRGN